jgi:cell division protein ZapA (FtsZ GTPase activity inhibitor)
VSYATVDDVQARAGRARIALSQAHAPDNTEIERFLEDVAAELDAKMSALGADVPTTNAVVVAALRGVNADGALILALDATYPSSQSDKAVDRLLDRTERRYRAAMDQIEAGTWPAIQVIVEGGEGAETAAADFWSNDPTYGLSTRSLERWSHTKDTLPGVEKGMSF